MFFFMRCSTCLLASTVALSSAAIAQTTQPAPSDNTPHGTVLFNRDENSPPVKQATASREQSIGNVTDEERASLTFTQYDLDAHLEPAKSRLAVHARFTVRNSGTTPLAKLALQLSSSLNWERFTMQRPDKVLPLSFAQHTIDTDADHTGQANEAVVSLAQPLAPGARLELTALYSGEIAQSGKRLERIGAPADQAARADWDRIAQERTALRGFGNVLWYPTAAAPVFLGDGAKLFQLVGKTKLLQADATIHLRLTVEYIGDPPDAAYFCGHREPLIAVSENANEPVARAPGVATAEFAEHSLGFRAPSLFVTDRAATATDGNLIAAVTDHYDAVPNYAAAAAKVQPLLKEWLGVAPLTTLNILDQDGQPFEDDAFLVAPVGANRADALAPTLVHALTHAWFGSSQVWLNEGVAQFMSLLWMEQSDGRDVALKQLQDQVNTLALTEPVIAQSADSGGEGQSLVRARDEVYYRTKAAAVLWMLRSIVGDDALKRALQLYRRDPKNDIDPKGFQRVLEQSAKRDLRWFFDDWVYRDRGLADLTIVNVTPRALPANGNKGAGWLIAVEVRNDGDAAAEVPVTVRSGALTTTEKLRIAGKSSASTRIVFEGNPEEVIVNDGSVPEMTAARHTKSVVLH